MAVGIDEAEACLIMQLMNLSPQLCQKKINQIAQGMQIVHRQPHLRSRGPPRGSVALLS